MHAQYCIGNIIRVGLTFDLNEILRETVLKEMCKIMDRYMASEHAIVCLLREIAILCRVLGEAVIPFSNTVLDAVLLSVKHPSEYVRYVGSMALRALAESVPDQTQQMLAALVTTVQISHAEATTIKDPQMLIREANSLHGNTCALSALISAISKYPMAVSHSLCSVALDTATLLYSSGTTSNTDAYVIMRRRDACWTLISAVLSLNEYWVKMNLEKIMDLWDLAMGTSASTKLTTEEPELSYQLRCRASAVLSFTVFIRQCGPLLTSERLGLVFKYIANTMYARIAHIYIVFSDLISSLPASYKPTSSAAVSSMNMLKMYLFECFVALPSSMLAIPQHRSIINFITKMAFAESDGTQSSVETSLLPTYLQEMKKQAEDDNLLDPNELAINGYFESISFTQDHIDADSSILFDDSKSFFFQKPTPIQVRVIDSAIRLLGRMFLFHKSNSRVQISEHLVHQLKFTVSKPEDARLSRVVFSNAIAVVYSVLSLLAPKKDAQMDDKAYVQHLHAVINSMCTTFCVLLFLASLSHPSNRVRRIAAECTALLGVIVGDVLIDDLFKRCAQKIVKEGPVRSGYALALGHVNRTLGSIVSLNNLPSTVSFLQTLARTDVIETQLAAFQAIKYTIDSTSASFAPHVDTVLQLLFMLLFSNQKNIVHEDYHVLLGASRVMEALIGMGPEVTQSKSYSLLFFYLMNDFMNSPYKIIQLEAARLIQRTAMLAPSLLMDLKTVVIPGLNKFLEASDSTSTKLRRQAAGAIKLISEKEPSLISAAIAPQVFFEWLNRIDLHEEEDKLHLQEIVTFLIKSRVYGPSKWIKAIYEIISNQPKFNTETKPEGPAPMSADEDDGMTPVQTAPVEQTIEPVVYSWISKVFALKCLRVLLGTYKHDTVHINMKEAKVALQTNPSQDFLVQHLAQMINTCALATQKGTVSIRHAGMHTMIELIKVFGDIPDPDVANEYILQQYAVSFGTAIGQGFENNTSPVIMFAACNLAAIFIPSKLTHNQANTVVRISGMLTSLLPKLQDLSLDQYGEAANTMVKVAVVEALARIFVHAHQEKNEQVLQVLEPHLSLHLIAFWGKYLTDYAMLNASTLDEAEFTLTTDAQQYVPSLYIKGIEKEVVQYFSKGFPFVMDALARLATQDPTSKAPTNQIHIPSVNPLLLIGLAMQTMHQRTNISKEDSLACIDTMKRLMRCEQVLAFTYTPVC